LCAGRRDSSELGRDRYADPTDVEKSAIATVSVIVDGLVWNTDPADVGETALALINQAVEHAGVALLVVALRASKRA